MAELNLWLDDYNDIYSDFDSRHYHKRRVSEDFVHELKQVVKFKTTPAHDLVLCLPKEKRKESAEQVITGSLNDFFLRQYKFYHDKLQKAYRRYFLFLLTGIAAMTVNAYLIRTSEDIIQTFRVLLEPAGWFFLWSALDFLFFGRQKDKEERTLYKELSEMSVRFRTA